MLPMLTHEELIARIDAHLAGTGESPAAFGRRVAGDSNLLRDLRNGRSPRLRLVHEILGALHAAENAGDAPQAANHQPASLTANAVSRS
jgi:hypothetical protein